MDVNILATGISEVCDSHREQLLALVRILIDQQSEITKTYERDEEVVKTRRTLDQIMAKEFATPNEAAVLLSCSSQHLRNQVQKAIAGTVDPAIPFCDLGGPVVFPIAELLEWSRKPKPKRKRRKKAE
jgi:hypothetical protein